MVANLHLFTYDTYTEPGTKTNTSSTTMAPTAKIPVPTDNYDAPHALVASLTSLRAMAAAADAALDAVEASVAAQSERVEGLTDRAEAYRARVDELAAEAEGSQEDASRSASTAASAGLPQETAPPLRLELPASYDRAVGRSKHGQDQDDAAIIHASAMALAREAASAAVRDVLRRDRQLDDGRAALADAWLDRPTAFDEAAECAAAVESMTVPSLRSQTLPVEDEVAWYEAEAADAAEAAAAAAAASGGAARSSTGASSEEYEYDDAASVRTGMTGLTLSSRITTTTIGADGSSNVGGAVERRRQRQQAQLERRRRQRRREQQAASAASAAGGSAGGEQGGKAAASAAAAQAAVEDIFDRASAVRQQVLSGSLPYLADVLHDAYGCENESRPKTVDELVAVSTIPPPSSRR